MDILHLTFSESTGPSGGRDNGREGASAGGEGRLDMMEDPPPSLLLQLRDRVACLSSLSCRRLPISLTTLPLNSPGSLLLPLTGRGRGRGVLSTSADNPHIIIRGLGCEALPMSGDDSERPTYIAAAALLPLYLLVHRQECLGLADAHRPTSPNWWSSILEMGGPGWDASRHSWIRMGSHHSNTAS